VCDRPDLDPEEVASSWQAIVEGRPPTPVRIPAMTETCVQRLFQPVVPGTVCLEASPGRVWFPMPKVGTLEFELDTGRFFLTSPDDEKFDVDGYVVDRLMGVQVNIRVPKSRTIAPRTWVPGFPEHVIDDAHALVRKGKKLIVHHLPTRKELLGIEPWPLSDQASVAGTEVVRDPKSRFGARLIGGLVVNLAGTTTAFALDENGKALATIAGRLAALRSTSDGALVLAGFREPVLEVATVTSGGVKRESVKLTGQVDYPPTSLAMSAANGVVAIGLGSRLVLLRPGAEPFQKEMPRDLVRADQLKVLASGRVVVAEAAGRTWVFDTKTGEALVEDTSAQPAFMEGPEGVTAVLLVDSHVKTELGAVVVRSDGQLKRGAFGKTRVGRFEVSTFVGVPHPGAACAAKVLSAMPPMVFFGHWVLPKAALRFARLPAR
jgi:hypothetical protein